jgi:hypothetical protein
MSHQTMYGDVQMDKVTLVGQDGKPKYELNPDNSVTDLRDHCTCNILHFDYIEGMIVCTVCHLPIS